MLHYLSGNKDLGLFYQSKQDTTLIGFTYVGCLSVLHKTKSQNGYVFTYEGTVISWSSTKETLNTKLIALCEHSKECI